MANERDFLYRVPGQDFDGRVGGGPRDVGGDRVEARPVGHEPPLLVDLGGREVGGGDRVGIGDQPEGDGNVVDRRAACVRRRGRDADHVSRPATGLAGLHGHRCDRVVRHFIANPADNALRCRGKRHVAGSVGPEDAVAVDGRDGLVRGAPGDGEVADIVGLVDHGGLVAHGYAHVEAAALLGDLHPVERWVRDGDGNRAASAARCHRSYHDFEFTTLEGLDCAGGAVDREPAASSPREEENGHFDHIAVRIVGGGGDLGLLTDLEGEWWWA